MMLAPMPNSRNQRGLGLGRSNRTAGIIPNFVTCPPESILHRPTVASMELVNTQQGRSGRQPKGQIPPKAMESACSARPYCTNTAMDGGSSGQTGWLTLASSMKDMTAAKNRKGFGGVCNSNIQIGPSLHGAYAQP